MSLDQFLYKKYHKEIYTCLHFTRDVWQHVTGEDISDKLQGLLDKDRRISKANLRSFEKLSRPQHPCLVYMKQLGEDPHIGVYLAGSLMHIHSRTGPEFLPLDIAARGFTDFGFYR